jgi:hypothetical protein
MNRKLTVMGIRLARLVPYLLALLLFWFILSVTIPSSFSQYFHGFSLGLFLIVIASYYVSFSLPEKWGSLAALSLTMVLLSLPLSYMWTSGFSDHFVIGGLLPYKDGKNYYAGATLLLHGLPMLSAGQATERPLFPGFLASLLWLTRQNLKITLGLIVQLVGISLFLSAQEIRRLFGVLAASLFASLLFFYMQSLIGYTLSELLGFMAGCLGFTIILQASAQRKWWDLLLGFAVLLVGVSARAGAFFIFPMLALWMGWIFRENGSFNLKRAAYALILMAAWYFLINSLYARLLGIPPGFSFGNFSYALYGQVRGGTGWHSAIADLGTRDPNLVYRAALDFFLKHPLSLLIGTAKSYRDFFWKGDRSIFNFYGQDWQQPLNIVLWMGLFFLLVSGVFQMFKGIRINSHSLLLAGLIGILLSIPFLPPIDGGSRFYAATIPFFFAVLIAGTGGLSRPRQNQMIENDPLSVCPAVSRFASIILLVMVLLVPPTIYTLAAKPAMIGLECPEAEKQFLIAAPPGSYIDLIGDPSMQCGSLPQVCLNDFENNNIEFKIDDYYQEMSAFAKSDSGSFRLVPALNLVNDDFRYFFLPLGKIPRGASSDLIAGCGIESRTRNQSIFEVKSVLSDKK